MNAYSVGVVTGKGMEMGVTGYIYMMDGIDIQTSGWRCIYYANGSKVNK